MEQKHGYKEIVIIRFALSCTFRIKVLYSQTSRLIFINFLTRKLEVLCNEACLSDKCQNSRTAIRYYKKSDTSLILKKNQRKEVESSMLEVFRGIVVFSQKLLKGFFSSIFVIKQSSLELIALRKSHVYRNYHTCCLLISRPKKFGTFVTFSVDATYESCERKIFMFWNFTWGHFVRLCCRLLVVANERYKKKRLEILIENIYCLSDHRPVDLMILSSPPKLDYTSFF